MIENNDSSIRKYLTPYRYPRPVLHGSGKEGAFDSKAVDIPFVFWHGGRFHMLYTGFDGIGYQSALAVSDDLIHWDHKGVILKRRLETHRWDRVGGAATWILRESNGLYDLPRLKKADGKYWLVYHSYPESGYESGPAEIGFAWTEDEELLDWHFPDRPVFSWRDGEDWEAGGLYKACFFRKDHRYYMFYNAKDREARWTEQTGLATSVDLEHWERCPENPVLKVDRDSWDKWFLSDPCILQDGNRWLNFFFGYGKLYEDGHTHAQEGLAVSGDLVHWEKVRDPILPRGKAGSFDSGHAHKASVIYHDGILYHFYCGTCPYQEGFPTNASGEYRTICLATDKPLPDSTGHILPFLWLKGEGNELIEEELERIADCGIREVCLESRPHPDFCGPLWWENLDFILPRARSRGMRVWLLDDKKFPTGYANGGYERQPDRSKVYLAERHMDICGPCREGAVLVKNFIGREGRLLGILAAPKPDGETLAVSAGGILDLTDRYHENGFVYFDLPEGAYRLFVLFTTRKGGGRENYMNLIEESSVRVLIDEVYEKHYERYREYFGNTIAGFFSDEPELGNVKGYPFDNTLGKKDVRLPWSRALEEELREAWGGEFLVNLPALWYDRGQETTAIRWTYMDKMTNLVGRCFSGQVGRWCREHGVEYIGHIIEDDNAHTRMGCSVGHYFREMAGQHMAGIDVVHHQIVPGFTEKIHQWIAGDSDGEFFHFGLAKLAVSAAHIQENKKGRSLCEIFGNYGWAEGNSLMKWLTNHMLVRGINHFTPHAFSMSYPDPDCPPHFYARGNHPGFACFRKLMGYMERGAEFISRGERVVDAAVLYHAEAEWCAGEAGLFQKPGRVLMECQMDYDVIPCDVLCREKASVEKGLLKIGSAVYPCVVLPRSVYLERKAAEFLAWGAKQGLKVFVLGEKPGLDTSGEALPEEFLKSAERVELKSLGTRVRSLEEALRVPRLEIRPEAGVKAKDIAGLRSLVLEQEDALAVMLFLENVSGAVSVRLRPREASGELHTGLASGELHPGEVSEGLHSVEASEDLHPGEVSVRDTPRGSFRGVVTGYDLWNLDAVSYELPEEGFPLRMEPGEAVFLRFWREGAGGPVSPRPVPRLETSSPLAISWHVQAGEEELILKGGEPLPNLNGPEYFPAFTGVFRYQGTFVHKPGDGRKYLLSIPEASDSVRVVLNHKDLGWQAGFPARVDITEALSEGENLLMLEVANTPVWQLRDGASTHLALQATGITRPPVVEAYCFDDN